MVPQQIFVIFPSTQTVRNHRLDKVKLEKQHTPKGRQSQYKFNSVYCACIFHFKRASKGYRILPVPDENYDFGTVTFVRQECQNITDILDVLSVSLSL